MTNHEFVLSDLTGLAVRSVFKPRIGRSLAFNRPWSHSTRLLAYLIVLCNAWGSNSSITFANVAARSVMTSSGSPCSAIAVVRNFRVAVTSRRVETYTSMTWPYPSTAR